MSSVNADLRVIGTDGVGKYVAEIDGRPRVSATPFLHDVAMGKIPGYSGWAKTGANEDVDVGTEDLWSVGGEYVWATSGTNMEVVSSSMGDSATGAGIRAVRVNYLTTDGIEKAEAVALNGTAAVATTSGDLYRVQNFRATSCGTSGKAIGTVDIRALADTPIYSRIAVGHTRARNITWTVPAGKTLKVRAQALVANCVCNAYLRGYLVDTE